MQTNELTRAEYSLMLLVSKGYSDKRIARKLHISTTTITTHLKHIYEKYKIKNKKCYNTRARATFLFMREDADNE